MDLKSFDPAKGDLEVVEVDLDRFVSFADPHFAETVFEFCLEA